MFKSLPHLGNIFSHTLVCPPNFETLVALPNSNQYWYAYLTAINSGMLYVTAINNDMLYLKAMSNSNHFENYICMQQGIRAILGYNQLCVSRNAYNREFVQSLFMGQPMDRLELVQILNTK